MGVARVRVPPGVRVDVEPFSRIAGRYGYEVVVEEDPQARGVMVEVDGLRFPGTDYAARHLAWMHLRRALGLG